MLNIFDVIRDTKGKFVKGVHYSTTTEFKKGQHWRELQPYWNKEFLINLYINEKKSCTDIAKMFNRTAGNISYFLHKFNIPLRNTSETRKVKHWGMCGKTNPMSGRRGDKHHNWNGGHSAERQKYYSRYEWKVLKQTSLKRDCYKCQRCFCVHSTKNKLITHHIMPWSRFPEYRYVLENIVTVCTKCHKIIHHNHKQLVYPIK